MSQWRSVVIEADGGSRGNPGDAAYGAVLRDAGTGEIIADRAERIGVATNNVAEYRGLIAGLELYREHADGADLEVRMDSRLVVEQMSGTWKIKHPDMKPLAAQAARLAPLGTTYTWIPREQNKYADRILNEVLDGKREDAFPQTASDPQVESAEVQRAKGSLLQKGPRQPVFTLILVRHGETDHTRERRFSGSGGADPALNGTGQGQVRATAAWLTSAGIGVDAVLSSPLLRTQETATVIADALGGEVVLEPGLVEASFGAWEGMTFGEARKADQEGFDRWLGSPDVRPGGDGETLLEVQQRVADTVSRLIAAHEGKTVVVASHVTPIKSAVISALGLPISAQFKLEISPASVTILSYYPDGSGVLRMFNGGPELTTR
jgi:probable phosphoglycerate mutase